MRILLLGILAGILAIAQFSSSNLVGKRAIDSTTPTNGCHWVWATGSSSWTCAGGVTAVDPGCSVAADLGKQWIDTSSAITTHLKVCVNVASVAAWVQVI